MRENTLITIIVAAVAFGLGWLAGAEYQRRHSDNIFRIEGQDWRWEFHQPKDGRASFQRDINEKLLVNQNREEKSDWRNK
jgi:hypothetical protein